MLSTNELKELILEEHKREVKITLIKNVVYLTIAIVLIYSIYTFAYDQAANFLKGVQATIGQNKDALGGMYKYIVGAILFSGIGYFIYNIITVIRRKSKIIEFMEKVESGKIAANVSEATVYKVVLAFGKFKIYLFPMNFVNVNFSQEIKMYNLPIPKYATPDLRVFLSGVKSEDLGKAWYELYDGATTETIEKSELKSIEEFQHFVKSDLTSEIEEIEKKRSKGKKTYIMYLIPTILVVLGWIGIQYGLTTGKLKIDSQTMIYGFIGFFAVFYLFIYLVKILPNRNKPIEEDFATQFKTKVFNKIIQYINPNFKYLLHGHISLPEFLETGFFENKGFSLDGNDQIIGKHSGVPFQLCDLNVDYERNFSRENEGPDEVFFGQIFIAKFNKEFKNDVYIIPKKVEGSYFSKSDTSFYLDNLGEKVKLEDPEFSKMFTVYSTDQIEARYILSTSLMERIKDIAKSNPKGKYMISFRNNRISIANNSRKNNFEVSMFKSITKNNQTVQFYEELTNQIKIIDDLKLNVNIWKS